MKIHNLKEFNKEWDSIKEHFELYEERALQQVASAKKLYNEDKETLFKPSDYESKSSSEKDAEKKADRKGKAKAALKPRKTRRSRKAAKEAREAA